MASTDVGRNDPCPCGSGAKYKHCCLRKQKDREPSSRSDWRRRFLDKFERLQREAPDRSFLLAGRRTAEAALEAWQLLHDKLPASVTSYEEAEEVFGSSAPDLRWLVRVGRGAVLDASEADAELAEAGARFLGEVLERFDPEPVGRKKKMRNERVELLIRAGRHEEAAEIGREIIDEDPGRAVGYALVGEALLEGGEPDRAVEVLEEGVETFEMDIGNWRLGERLRKARSAAEPGDDTQMTPAEYYNTPEGSAEWEAFWEEFGEATLDGKFEMAREAIDEEPYFDGEWAFQLMIDRLLEPAKQGGDEAWRRWIELVDRIRERHPLVAREETGPLAAAQIRLSLWLGGDPAAAVDFLFEAPGDHIDHLFDSLDTLAYAGVVDDLPGQLDGAWKEIRTSAKVTSAVPPMWARWRLRTAVARWAEQDIEQTRPPEDIEQTLGAMAETLDPELYSMYGEVFLGERRDEWLLERAERRELEEDETFEAGLTFARVLVDDFDWAPFRALLVDSPLYRLFRAHMPQVDAPSGDFDETLPRRLRQHLEESSWIVPDPDVVDGVARLVEQDSALGAMRRAAAYLEAVFCLVDWLEDRQVVEKARMVDSIRHHLRKRIARKRRKYRRIYGDESLLEANMRRLLERLEE